MPEFYIDRYLVFMLCWSIKIIENVISVCQPVRFRLNTASNQGKVLMNEREFSLWVGDLSPEVDDYTLYKTFAARYQSIKAAKGKYYLYYNYGLIKRKFLLILIFILHLSLYINLFFTIFYLF
jgi:hypothetical protein